MPGRTGFVRYGCPSYWVSDEHPGSSVKRDFLQPLMEMCIRYMAWRATAAYNAAYWTTGLVNGVVDISSSSVRAVLFWVLAVAGSLALFAPHSLDKPDQLSQRLCRDNNTIKIVCVLLLLLTTSTTTSTTTTTTTTTTIIIIIIIIVCYKKLTKKSR